MALTSRIELPETGIEAWVKSLALMHGLTSDPDALSLMAHKLTSLSGDDIEISATERRLIKLYRKGVLSKEECLCLVSRNFREKKAQGTQAQK